MLYSIKEIAEKIRLIPVYCLAKVNYDSNSDVLAITGPIFSGDKGMMDFHLFVDQACLEYEEEPGRKYPLDSLPAPTEALMQVFEHFGEYPCHILFRPNGNSLPRFRPQANSAAAQVWRMALALGQGTRAEAVPQEEYSPYVIFHDRFLGHTVEGADNVTKVTVAEVFSQHVLAGEGRKTIRLELELDQRFDESVSLFIGEDGEHFLLPREADIPEESMREMIFLLSHAAREKTEDLYGQAREKQ